MMSRKRTKENLYEPLLAGLTATGTQVYVAGPNNDVVIIDGKETVRPRGKELLKDSDGMIQTDGRHVPRFTEKYPNLWACSKVLACCCCGETEDDQYDHQFMYTGPSGYPAPGLHSPSMCGLLDKSKERHYKKRLDDYHAQKAEYERHR